MTQLYVRAAAMTVVIALMCVVPLPVAGGTEPTQGGMLALAGYFGGSGTDDAYGVATDSQNNVYVIGSTESPNLPAGTVPGFDQTLGGTADAFLAKFAPDGVLLGWTYIGGSGEELATTVTVDSADNVYVAGPTDSGDGTFPVAGPGLDATYNGNIDTFIVKFDPNFNLVASGFLGGSGVDYGYRLAVDGMDNVLLTGVTSSTAASFPDGDGGATMPDPTFNGGNSDCFVAKLTNDLEIVFAGYLGGSGIDLGLGLAADETGAIVVVGYTLSGDGTFPATAGVMGLDTTFNGEADGFVVKLTRDGAIEYAGYVGGSGSDVIWDIALTAKGKICLTGYTESTETTFPDGDGGLTGSDPTYNGGLSDVFLVIMSLDGALETATYVGGGDIEFAQGVVVTPGGKIVLGGYTRSTETTFLQGALDRLDTTFNGGGDDAFVVEFDVDGNLLGGGYIGGSGDEQPVAMAVDAAGAILLAGGTTSAEASFPDGDGAPIGFDVTYNGNMDAFVAKIVFPMDFALVPAQPVIRLARKASADIVIGVDRIGGFSGPVTVTGPDVKPIKAKLTPASVEVTDDPAVFRIKTKKKTPVGTHELVFTGRDAMGAERTATVTLVVE